MGADLTLDAAQVAALALDAPRVLLDGIAGTGKTAVAVQRAEAWIEEGLGVLVLTATDPLARWWERRVPEALCRSVPRLSRLILARAGASLDDDEEDYWDRLPREGAAAVLTAGDGWDAVIVDGASDVSDGGWDLADACATGGVLWACRDPLRRFWPDRAVPVGLFDERHVLETVHRRPELVEVARRYLKEEPGEAPVPDCLELAVDRSPQEVVEALLAEGEQASRIALLSLRGRRDHRALVNRHDVEGVSGSAWEVDEAVVLETFLRFSGLERPIVVLGDLPIVEDRLDDRMYLAMSRATERVIVCAPRAVLEHDEILYDGLERLTSR